MLTDANLFDLAKRMNFDLERVCFKDELLEEPLKYNKGYIINLEDEIDAETGEPNGGTHWCCFQMLKHPNGKTEGIYMDPFGVGPPEIVKTFCGKGLASSGKDIQGLYDNYCGWACCAFLHWINSAGNRTKDLYTDTETFLDMFEDLKDKKMDSHNEFVIKQFFKKPKIAVNF
jgi:hypothetical protein